MDKVIVKEDEQVELSNVDGDLEVSDGAIIEVSPKVDKLKINGKFIGKGDILIRGAIEVEEILHKEGYLEIEGDVIARRIRIRDGRSGGSKLIVAGFLEAEETNIDGGLEVEQDFNCPMVNIMGSCSIFGDTNAEIYKISGSAKHDKNLKAKEAEIGGTLKIANDAVIEEELEVSGSAKIEGVVECPKVEIGGSFKCGELISEEADISGSARTELAQVKEKLSVSGSYRCEQSLIAGKVTTSGSFRTGDDSSIEKLNVSGSAGVGDNSKVLDVKINGSFSVGANSTGVNIIVNGSFSSSELLKIEQKLVVNGTLSGEEIESQELEVNGGISCRTARGELIKIGQDSRVRGKLIGGTVIVERGARVEDIEADTVELGPEVRARLVQASNIDADPSAKYNKD